ncbi:hypothetical protein [Leptolinea tardivitalis]|uniref:SAM-dependent MTase RsmB/NOP-type domain-containing protein n=1 Tax=Leptolinea tardivitalis TaxID=229920 RepID=A0A0P6WQN2_9CHLR|nr:hypothetical protein [Leptolinea tardivitalis]KPL71145.1 hypothetical protein ADM99_12850 [Leptolinea tardivitalis]GAP22580.1 tRNA and rRNA cytosine-C5-methylases [Leptolinea tardivitalis]
MKQKRAFPADPIGRYRELLSEKEAALLESSLINPAPTAIRVNPLKAEPRQLSEEMSHKYQWDLQPVPHCRDGFTMTSSLIPPGHTLEGRLGYFYIQDAASMLPVELFEPVETTEPLILDLTASPGGKTAHLASRFHDRGLILANDGTSSRIPALTSTLKNWGAACSAVTNFPGERFGQWFPETFDLVLLDAPCSMENLHPGEKNKRDIKPPERSRLAQRQVQLLMSALQACKVGGQVVYSTCTLAPEEDEGVVDTILRLTGHAVTITPAAQRLGVQAPGLESAFGQTFSPETVKSLRLWPHRLRTSGFFSAHFRKNSSLPGQSRESPTRPYLPSHIIPLGRKDQEFLISHFAANYGVDLTNLLEGQALTLGLFKQSVYLLPHILENSFAGLPVNSSGLRLGDYAESGFEPSLEWTTRYGKLITGNRYNLSPDNFLRWSRGEDVPYENAVEPARGTILVMISPEGYVAGTGRMSSRGIKNLLPRHLALKS